MTVVQTTSTRTSYRKLMNLPAYGAYDPNGKLVATIRAKNAYAARNLFYQHGLHGFDGKGRIKKI